MARPDMCIIFNPNAGRGRARRRLAQVQTTFADRAELWPTDRPTHAEELALRAVRAGFRVVAAAGGDGTVHEVVNGLLRAGNSEACLAVLPIGSANDYAHSLGLASDWWLQNGATKIRHVDAGLARAANGRELFFMNGLGLGFNCMVTLETLRVPWLRGVPLYACGLLRALCCRYAFPKMTIELDSENHTGPTLALTLAIGRREGNFVLAPDAVVDDGLFDYLHVGPLPRRRLLRYVPRMITGRLPTWDPLIATGRCRQALITSEAALAAHCDGEILCRPEDDVRSVDVRMLPGALRVLCPK